MFVSLAVINVLLSCFVILSSVHVVTFLFKLFLFSVLCGTGNLAATNSSLSTSIDLSCLALISVVHPASGQSECSLAFDV